MLSIEYKLIEGTDEETEGVLHDTIAALYNLWYSSSSLISPIIGGALYDSVGYKSTMDITMIGILIVTIIYFKFNCGFKVYQTTREEMKEVNRLKEIKNKIMRYRKGEPETPEQDDESPLPTPELLNSEPDVSVENTPKTLDLNNIN